METLQKKIVIIKWDPAFSSYSMLVFLSELTNACYGEMADFNWSVWDYDKVHVGDIIYWLKVGFGQNGIVGKGVITSEPYPGADWSGKGRETFYIDFVPEIMINPDAWKLLDSDILNENIPEFDWRGGHSGLILENNQAQKLEELWTCYMEKNLKAFKDARYKDKGADRIFLSKKMI